MSVQDKPLAGPDLVQRYLTDIGQHALLTWDDEVTLGHTIRTGLEAEERLNTEAVTPTERRLLRRSVEAGQVAQHKMTEANLRLVVSVAKRYTSDKRELLDLVQDGNIGLMRAVTRFDERKGFKFSTYATWWIRQGIERGLNDADATMRVPNDVSIAVRAAYRLKSEIESTTGRTPSIEELAAILGVTTDTLRSGIDASKDALRLDAPLLSLTVEGAAATLTDTVACERPAPEDEVTDEAARQALLELVKRRVDTLKPRDRDVVMLRFGFGPANGKKMSFREIGEHVGVSGERARSILRRSLDVLINDFKPQPGPRHPNRSGPNRRRPSKTRQKVREPLTDQDFALLVELAAIPQPPDHPIQFAN